LYYYSQVAEETNKVVLNALDLKLGKVFYLPDGGAKEDEAAKFELSEENETLTIFFDSPLKQGKGVLSIAFNGELNDKMKGFYRSQYTRYTYIFIRNI
jgi:aminopeptidase N